MGELRPAAWPGDHPLFQSYGLAVEQLGDGTAVLATGTPERFGNRRGGGLHGGAYGGLGACAAEIAAATVAEPGYGHSFVEYRVQILRPLLVGTRGTISARVLQRGRRYTAVAAEIANAEGRLCAFFTGTLAVERLPANGTAPAPAGSPPPPAGSPPPLAPPAHDYEESASWATFGVRVTGTAPGYGCVSSHFDPEFAGHDGALHPAFVAAVADSVTVPACATVKADDEAYTTLEYKVNFLRPVTGGPLRAEGRIPGRDHRAFVVNVDVLDSTGTVCATMLTSLAVLKQDG